MASCLAPRAQAAAAPPTFGPDTALLVVDMQRDFMDADNQHSEGPVPVAGARARVPLVTQLMAAAVAAGAAVAASRDWHPPDHISFVSSHPGSSKRPGDAVQVVVGGKPLMVSLFRPHCVAGTAGAEFAGPPPSLLPLLLLLLAAGRQAGGSAGARPCIHSCPLGSPGGWPTIQTSPDASPATSAAPPAEGLDLPLAAHTVHKGTQAGVESFSAFYDMARSSSAGKLSGRAVADLPRQTGDSTASASSRLGHCSSRSRSRCAAAAPPGPTQFPH